MHTPGQWSIHPRNDKGPRGNILIRDATGHTLAEIVLRDPPREDRANARVIAAAPDMLEALGALLPADLTMHEIAHKYDVPLQAIEDAFSAIEAAS